MLTLVDSGTRIPSAVLMTVDRSSRGARTGTVRERITNETDAEDARETLEAETKDLEDYLLALAHWRLRHVRNAVRIGVPIRMTLHQIWTLVGDYQVSLWEWAPTRKTAGWIAGHDARMSTLANIEDNDR